jgi:pimeloyl-ACP methyl ester carboxylesterase
VLALHGWLDNAASFVPLAPLMTDHGEEAPDTVALDMVAPDWPGHGRSQHRHASSHYYFTDYLWDIHAAMDALGWDSCHLLAHSMGGAISTIFAAAAPQRVRSLVLIDALGPIADPASKTTHQLRRSSENVRGSPRRRKTYASVDDMVRARLANSDMSEEAARLVTERSVQPTEGGFEWTNDPRLYWHSPVRFTEEQVLDCLHHIEATTLCLGAVPFSPWLSEEKYLVRKQAFRNGRFELIDGGHHFHMEQAELIAPKVQCFILEQELEYRSRSKEASPQYEHD